MSDTRKRLYYLDAVRVLACAMVVLMHSPRPFEGAAGSGIFQNIVNYMTAPCIGLFFMVSGALLLPVKETASVFLKHRLSKVIWPTLFWTGFYLGVCYYAYGVEGNMVLNRFLSIPFSPQGSGILWFMYTLIGLYLIAPIISPWINSASKAIIELYLVLWAISLCFPLLEVYLTISTGPTSSFYYLSGYIGYFVLGYYMNRYPMSLKWRLLGPMMVISLGVPVYCKVIGIHVDFMRVFWYLSIFVAVMCAGWFKAFKTMFNSRRLINREFPMIAWISALSFGIYLSHIIILRNILWYWSPLNQIPCYAIYTFAVAALAFVGALAVSYLLSLLPFGAYIVGVHNKLNSPRIFK